MYLSIASVVSVLMLSQIRCVEEVNARGWNVEGLYRVPGYV